MLKSPQLSLFFVLLLVAPVPSRAQTTDGAALFDKHCAACHGGAGVERAPSQDALRQRSPESILTALVSGVMTAQGAQLTEREQRAVAEYVSGRSFSGSATIEPAAGRCVSSPQLADPMQGPRWNGWGITATNTRFQPASHAGLTADRVPKLRLRWAFGFPGESSARAQPTVASGRVFVGSEAGVVYSLDARTRVSTGRSRPERACVPR